MGEKTVGSLEPGVSWVRWVDRVHWVRWDEAGDSRESGVSWVRRVR